MARERVKAERMRRAWRSQWAGAGLVSVGVSMRSVNGLVIEKFPLTLPSPPEGRG
jgi:hypothetical protein